MTRLPCSTPPGGRLAAHNLMNLLRSVFGARPAIPLLRRRGRAWARGATAAALFCLSEACLVPQNVEPTSSKPNVPPRVVVESLPTWLSGAQVQLLQSALDRAEGCHCEIELQVPVVEMDDPTANLLVRWFVDYDPTRPPSQRPVSSRDIKGTFVDPSTQRAGPRYSFDLGALGIVGDGTHVVDMLIADQDGFDADEVAPAFRAMRAGYASAMQRFVIAVTTDDARRCPAQLPSRRVCASTGADGGSP